MAAPLMSKQHLRSSQALVFKSCLFGGLAGWSKRSNFFVQTDLEWKQSTLITQQNAMEVLKGE